MWGDGASIGRKIVRRDSDGGQHVGHAAIGSEIEWYKTTGLPGVFAGPRGAEIIPGAAH